MFTQKSHITDIRPIKITMFSYLWGTTKFYHMGNYDYINGVMKYKATPLDYLHSILYEYEWLMLLKGNGKPYEVILDQLYDLAKQKRYGSLNLEGTRLTMKWISEQLQVKAAQLSKWVGMMFTDIQDLNKSKPELFINEGQVLCEVGFHSPHNDYFEFRLGFEQIPRKGDNITFYYARSIIDEGNFVVTDIEFDHSYGKVVIYIECKPRYLEDEYRNWLLNKAYFLRDLRANSIPNERYILDSMLRTYARKGEMPDAEEVKEAWEMRSK